MYVWDDVRFFIDDEDDSSYSLHSWLAGLAIM